MLNSLIFQLLTLTLVLGLFLETNSHKLLQEIHSTQQLINLYQEKLQILIEMAERQNIDVVGLYNKNNNAKSNQNIDNTSPQQSQHPSPPQKQTPSTPSTSTAPTKPPTSLFKLQKQIIFPTILKLSPNTKYIFPNYLINGSQIYDLNSQSIKSHINLQQKGQIVCLQSFQITTRKDDNTVITTRINYQNQATSQTIYNMKIQKKIGKWHHATHFPSIFLQHTLQTLTLTTQKQTKFYKFKSQIIQIYTIHQYKILYITRYSYGFLNPKSFQISQQTNFDSIVEAAYYSYAEGLIFVIFNDRHVWVMRDGKVLGRYQVGVGVFVGGLQGVEGEGKVEEDVGQIQMEYLGSNYLFVYRKGYECFHIFEVSAPTYQFSYYRQICLNQHFKSPHNNPNNLSYKFFKNREHYNVLITSSPSSSSSPLSSTQKQNSKLFHINLIQKQVYSERTFPWKIILIVVCVAAVVYFRTRTKMSSKQEYNISMNAGGDQQIRNLRKIKRDNFKDKDSVKYKELQKQRQRERESQRRAPIGNSLGNFSSANENYISNLNNQIKKIKNVNKKNV